MGFSRQEYWSGLPFPSPGDLPDPGIEPRSFALEAAALTLIKSISLINLKISFGDLIILVIFFLNCNDSGKSLKCLRALNLAREVLTSSDKAI